jgi:2-oxoglutarate ferredoxin oxidoreductase subunit gamma
MSQSGFDRFVNDIKEDGKLLIDQNLVQPRGFHRDFFSIPSTRFAEELGRKMMANIIMLGFLTAVTEAVSAEAAREAVEESVPRGTEGMNLKAFNKGWEYGMAVLKGRQKKASGRMGTGA